MNINKLKYFCTICDFQTVSNAAKYLHISQPSLSSAIKELESEFGAILFKRHSRGMMLTPEGEVLYKMGKDILNRAEQLENAMKDLGEERKKLRLGVPPMIGSIILPGIYRNFMSNNNDIQLQIVEGGQKELIQKLSDNYLDMIFVPHSQSFNSSMSSMSVAKLEIVCCASKNTQNICYEPVTPEKLAQTPLVLFENGFFQTEEIKKWFSYSGIIPNILMQTEQLSTMLSIISNNIAVGFMFKQLTENNPALISFSTKPKIHLDVSLVWKKDVYSFSSMNRFKEYMNTNNPFIINN